MKVAINVPADFAVWTFHRGLIAALQSRDADVTIIGPPGEYVEAIRRLGTRYITVELDRFMNPAKDMKLLGAFYRIFRRENFDLVHNHTIKPNIYGTLAAKLAGVRPILGSVRGRGSMFTEAPGLKRRTLKMIAMNLYRYAFRFIDRVQFLNGDDLDFFVATGMLRRDKAVLIRSSGVNLAEYSSIGLSQDYLRRLRSELGITADMRVVTMVARAYWSKGVREFVESAHRIEQRHPVKFLLVGSVEDGPDAVPETYLREQATDSFQWLNYRKDVRELMALSDVVVLPSYYPEGVPRSMLEAMAMEKPVVTTDSIGCREVVDHCRNGFMIPVRNSRALTTAIDYLLRDDAMRLKFGRYSRRKVEQEFDERVIVERVLTDLYRI
jgi:N,N'-diacetylbacillosaminyl-diphospho-undecaprenol alpha-1,3-N-acetylgalactosaminyltransferase